jgi:hypothetical protein
VIDLPDDFPVNCFLCPLDPAEAVAEIKARFAPANLEALRPIVRNRLRRLPTAGVSMVVRFRLPPGPRPDAGLSISRRTIPRVKGGNCR